MIGVGKGASAPFSYAFVCGLLIFGQLRWPGPVMNASACRQGNSIMRRAVPILIDESRPPK
jgi:hypothetical protein